MKKPTKKVKKPKSFPLPLAWRSLFVSKTDPDGSYTGNPTDCSQPTQDADDL